ncbi:MAG: amidohydrolase family protein [Gemmatimonadaceae bacterium]|nr:amidohydrolase family protein [Gemmatimonadaceae bacterium]NUQ92003.1 amidohydrolase family protein [Gemmatimonadaceae bacterium]NUR19153.1 amidohydrolase family protein [Gemmatimonadaceae bacterium]
MRKAALAALLVTVACTAASARQTPAPQRVATDSTAKSTNGPGMGATSTPNADPFPSTYHAFPSKATVIRNVTIMTAAGPTIRNGAVLLRDGRIAAVGASVDAPSDATVIDGTGKYLTPGIIDIHSHVGAGASPGDRGAQTNDVNEATNPSTPYVWVEHSVWPQDPQLPRVLAGGVTTIQVLPGSANLIGGRSVVLKMVPSRSVQGMKFPGAKYGLKMACGENPKRVYQQRGPSTRMGNVAGYRAQWIQAETYRRRWDKWNATHQGDPPQRDLGMETLAEVLRGNILVHNHCYRADEMMQMIDISHEFGYKIRAFHHGIEAYKVADVLAREGIGAALWADWGGFKLEANDAVRANLPLVMKAGARAIVHSDDESGIQRLNQEAAKAMAAGNRIGVPVSEDDAIKWLTINPAWALDLDSKIGSIEVGKNADVVLWSGDPFSVYSRTEKIWIDGAMMFDRADPSERWRTDFELGYVPAAQQTGGSK